MNEGNKIVPSWALLATAALAFVAIADLPYGYYLFLRWIVCGVAFAAAIQFFAEERKGWAWVLGAVVILFNPFFPLHYAKAVWRIFDGVTGLVLLVASRNLK